MFTYLGIVLCISAILYVGFRGLTSTAMADGGVDIAKTFPDECFRQYISDNFDTVKDGKLSESEIAAVTAIKTDSYNDGIYSVKGIEVFTGLKELECRRLDMPCIDLSKNTELTDLSLSECNLDVLDVSKNTKLVNLACMYNRIRVLDVSKNTLLESLYCTANELTELDISNNTKIVNLNCGGNPIRNLNVSMLPDLQLLMCANMQLKSLDVSENPKLNYLECSVNQLTSLNVSKNTELRQIFCYMNELQSLDLSKNTKVQVLDCSDNLITSLSFVNNTILQHLYCNENLLGSLNLTKSTILERLECRNNRLTTLNVTNNPKLSDLDCSGNRLTSLDLSGNPRITFLNCYSNKLTDLNLTGTDNLWSLNCLDNPLKTADIVVDRHSGNWDPYYIPIGTKITLRMPDTTGTISKYQWQEKPYADETWVDSQRSGAKTSALTFTFTKNLSKYAMQCCAYNSANKLIGTYDCQIVGGPAILNTNGRRWDWPYEIGDDFDGAVLAVGTKPLSYQWQIKKPGSSTWVNGSAASAKTDSFLFTLQPGHREMEISVTVTDANGLSESVGKDETEWYLILAPKLTAEPEDTLAEAGETVKFSVKATGAKTYQWQSFNPKKGVWVNSSAPSAKTATLSFTAQAGHDGMRFRCVVDGMVYTRSAALIINDHQLEIIKHPQDTTVEVGSSAVFTVVAKGKGTLTYQWYAYNPRTQKWVTSGAPGAKSAKLIVTAQSGHHGFLFRCVVSDATGKKVTSKFAVLKVRPAIKVQPTNKTVNAGQQAKFTIQAQGATPLSYQWQTFDTTLKRWVNCTAASAKTATLSFTAVQGHNGKKFRCVVTDVNKMSTPSKEVTLTVK